MIFFLTPRLVMLWYKQSWFSMWSSWG